MKIGAFEVNEPVPELTNPCAIAMLKPWVDVGRVGTLVLAKIEQHVEAKELARLDRPGTFFDFTRYRPRMRMSGGKRVFRTPNSEIRFGHDDFSDRDYVFLHLREPHAMAEDYIDSVVALAEHFGVVEYYRIGGMYDTVPHSRPLLVTGNLNEEKEDLAKGLLSPWRRAYQGPTSIVNLVGESLEQAKIETASLMAHLPQYVQLDEDHMGASRLLDVLCAICGLPNSLADATRGSQQYQEISRAVAQNPDLQRLITQFEAYYDKVTAGSPEAEEGAAFSPDVEEFLKSMGERFESGKEGVEED
ncbi:MAG: PAC2 family protein [Chloroflexi bacterium]|nr:PAC2 family protein [Chloroflexota bacterium]